MDRIPAMELALAASFGSVERWRSDFVALARSPARTGRVVLAFSPGEARMVNTAEGEVATDGNDGVPLLTLVSGAEVDAMLVDIDWADVYARYQHAVEIASEPFAAGADELAGALVLDVRRKAMFERAATRLPGAEWRDPADVATWSRELPAGHEVVVYCIYGHEVGRATALRLRAAGLSARFLRGGIDGWQAAGRPLPPKEAPQ